MASEAALQRKLCGDTLEDEPGGTDWTFNPGAAPFLNSATQAHETPP